MDRSLESPTDGHCGNPGKLGRQIGADPWFAAVLRESKGTEPTREAYVALPKRAVRAAYAALGKPRLVAEASPLYRVTGYNSRFLFTSL